MKHKAEGPNTLKEIIIHRDITLYDENNTENPQELLHRALFSNKPKLFNKILAKTDDPSKFETYEISYWDFELPSFFYITEKEAQVILQALDTNYTLIHVKFNFPSEVSSNLREKIKAKLQRNREIQKVISQFVTDQIKNPLPKRAKEEHLKKLGELLLPDVDVNKVYRLAVKKRSTINPYVIKLVDDELKRLQSRKGAFAFFTRLIKKDSSDKYHAFQALKKSLQKGNSLQQLTRWKEKYQDCINDRRNSLHTFFSPKHKTKSSSFVDHIESILTIQSVHL